MDVKQLYTMLKKTQEPKGYYFNRDMDMTMPLLESLLTNKERFGYMACPCRLANGEFEADKDIVCPCSYREEDVKEYGACFCALYVSKDYNDGTIEKEVVPERRPPEKILF
ncbi:ferredoxin-thioredoxin reductase catalytic domain-containing protein [uncultured Pseudodesulfovibrio sp.]|uniref:ferredoxin-thioredoxin reductase catalytic domain-containing protein n=1 Tax=uncultured Pseudodesulfovibrio sp. TaxID=2035858 RepID=UPI0029C7AC6A|nr:ferredoxin-thioredoxin reductase catalytic domain-containing protein [uncultured Pseudodesulfovibrio sp.]